ncbi:hypothetical protein [Falsiroseomonas sp. CW058]|uniref:hypothetical protein n=1 Tax=Falsiroseomonas sp. CW058 TaxID=3388664 RepID=UPI003D31E2F5
MSEPYRPPHQRWIKRPPRPSRPQVQAPQSRVRMRPGGTQLLMSIAFGISAGIVGAILGPMLIPRPGMGGLFAGTGFAIGFVTLWKGFGGTLQDIRDIFR